MKTKKKLLRITFVTLIFTFIITIFTTLVFFLVVNNKKQIQSIPDVTSPDKKPSDKKDFKKDDLVISFNTSQNIYLLKRDNNDYSFVYDNFKFFFLVEFNKLGPSNKNPEITFSIDSLISTKNINVLYKTNYKNYNWLFSLNNI
ncbi:hypothetical protein SCORR_v1c01370 [Spiroplasma corruscae]|uniref:Uncharacterized protein n=1 Tax=Spiroplasma corruscae TaxID=216934 RepID=A0A222EN40_9MOLU|nr:hypothetical protein [Spiroplasma corruscae]ASP27912.1 hypothetical protein SCORR_v1c01370 [Spiroplasma corruscae]